MTGTLEAELAELIPLALVVTFSPLSVLPVVLVLRTARPKRAGLAYLVGWVSALTAVTMAFVGVSRFLNEIDETPRWASWLRIVIGAALIAVGAYRWFTRHRSSRTPAWASTITGASPARAGLLGVVLAVANPKVAFICAAAGLSIGTAGMAADEVWFAGSSFVSTAAASVALPVLAVVVAGDRLREPLERLEKWMETNHAALVAAILLFLGLLALAKGIHTLT